MLSHVPGICIFSLSNEEFPESVSEVVRWIRKKRSLPDARYHFRKSRPRELGPGSIIIFSIEGKLIGQGIMKSNVRVTPSEMQRELKRESGHDYPHYLRLESSSLRVYKKHPEIAVVKKETGLKFARLFTYVRKIDQYQTILRMADATATEKMVTKVRRKILTKMRKTVVGKYGLRGEGRKHKKLKEWVSRHPGFMKIGSKNWAEIEYEFISGDRADVVFELKGGRYAVVEVETENPLPGYYQALKYKVLLCAELNLPITSRKIEAILVAWNIPQDVTSLCTGYGIRCLEKRI